MSDTPAQSNQTEEQVQPFAGFSPPHYTPVPDELLDDFLHVLSGAELKVILYIVRRTFGFKKDADDISLNQMLNGITKRDGQQLDGGTGLSKPTLLKALRSLKNRGLIVAERRQSEAKGDEATRYHLKMKGEEQTTNTSSTPVVKKVYQGGGKEILPSPGKKTSPHNKQLTKDRITITKETKTNNTLSSKEKVVVVVLIKKGLANDIAEKLVLDNKAKPAEKQIDLGLMIDYFEFNEAFHPERLDQNDTGWLRQACSKGYGKPGGYSKEWRDKLKAEEDQQAKENAAVEQRESQRDTLTRQAIETHATSKKLRDTWSQTLKALSGQMQSETYRHHFVDSVLLAIERDDEALIGVMEQKSISWLDRQWSIQVKRELENRLGQELFNIRFITLEAATKQGSVAAEAETKTDQKQEIAEHKA